MRLLKQEYSCKSFAWGRWRPDIKPQILTSDGLMHSFNLRNMFLVTVSLEGVKVWWWKKSLVFRNHVISNVDLRNLNISVIHHYKLTIFVDTWYMIAYANLLRVESLLDPTPLDHLSRKRKFHQSYSQRKTKTISEFLLDGMNVSKRLWS